MQNWIFHVFSPQISFKSINIYNYADLGGISRDFSGSGRRWTDFTPQSDSLPSPGLPRDPTALRFTSTSNLDRSYYNYRKNNEFGKVTNGFVGPRREKHDFSTPKRLGVR